MTAVVQASGENPTGAVRERIRAESSKQPNGAAFRYISTHAADTVYKANIRQTRVIPKSLTSKKFTLANKQ